MRDGNAARLALVGETLLEYRPSKDDCVVAKVSSGLSSVAIETMLPVRESPQWQGKTYYEGVYWSSTARGHIRYESFLEREYLISADMDLEITAMQWQPFILTWPRGTRGHRDHVPDYFCRLASGDGLVVDVKWVGGVERSARQFDMTREVCTQIGWHYEIFTGLPEPRRANTLFLSGFRQDRYQPSADLEPLIAEVCATPTTIADALNKLRWMTKASPDVIKGNLFHEMWRGAVSVNLDAPLDEHTVLTAPSLPRARVVSP
ncbi:TnsA-like heteromeric transposase endonuclease subunit [Demequina sp.]|uniref:TnsA-like heteromeric transposase endonuclease subunit n=1 Tax=Demequina sp. TaxID=2050685 RepID=UPI003D0BA462